MSKTPHEILRAGQRILADAGNDRIYLEKALSQIHSALGNHLRATLSRDERVLEEIRLDIPHAQKTNWPRLLDIAYNAGMISKEEQQTISRFNRIRREMEHDGEPFQGTPQSLVAYADLVEHIIHRDRLLHKAQVDDDRFASNMKELGIAMPAQASPRQTETSRQHQRVPKPATQSQPRVPVQPKQQLRKTQPTQPLPLIDRALPWIIVLLLILCAISFSFYLFS